jgi:uncharacterized delta-60 repeat protein
MTFAGRPWKALNGLLILGMAFAPIGAPAGALPLPASAAGSLSFLSSPPSSTACPTQVVRLTLASEQISFCSPTALEINVVEDNLSDPDVNYAGLNQLDGYAIVNIRATAPGQSPGPDLPVYSGSVADYRQAIILNDSSQPNWTVSVGPSALLWGETSSSIQVDFAIVTSTDEYPLRTVEWFFEHNGRLWIFLFAWDTTLNNAVDWQAASENFTVQSSSSENLPDTAVDLGKAFLDSQSGSGEIQAAGGPIDIGLPTWWENEICDYSNYYGATGRIPVALGAPWHGVYACGTNPMSAMVDYRVYFGGGSALEFECVELVLRFLYLEWAIPPWYGNANQLRDYRDTSKVDFYPNDGSPHPIIPGDAITEDGSVGHTMLVTDVVLGSDGSGTLNILEQNAISSGHRSIAVTNWVITDSWTTKHVQGWLHAKANQAAGDPDSTFSPATGLGYPVNAMALQSDGRIVIGGEFVGYESTPRSHIARLNTNGTLDITYDPGDGVSITSGTPQVFALKAQSDDEVLIGGQFDRYDTTGRANIARIDTLGKNDASFTPPATMTAASGTASINAIAIQPADSKILIGGNFNDLNGGTNDFIARLDNNGSVDTTFTTYTDGTVYAILVQANGKILVGGSFSHVNGTARSGIARLNGDGTLDNSFTPTGTITGIPAGQAVTAMAFQSIVSTEEKILIAGNFSQYNGINRNMIARLKGSDGSLDTTFDPNPGVAGTAPYLTSVVPQPDGRILVGGKFDSYKDINDKIINLNTLIRLNNNGRIDGGFIARLDPDTVVNAILLEPDNHILIAGDFDEHVSRLLNQIESCYTLTTSATPSEGGSVDASAPNCPGSKYISSSTVSLMPDPNDVLEYAFIGWSGDASGAANPLSVTMTRNKSITANFLNPPGFLSKTSPANETTGVPSSVTLSWNASDRADSYEYCLYTTDPNHCDAGTGDWVSGGSNTSATVNNLLPSSLYHWQVRARNQVDTTDAAGGYWTFTRNDIPAVPITLSPSGMISSTQPAFKWNVSPGATSYHLVVDRINLPGNVINETALVPPCSGGVCTYQSLYTLPYGDYQFEVSASLTSGGTSAYSSWRTFDIRFIRYFPIMFK